MPDNDLHVPVTTDCDVDYSSLPRRLHEYYDVVTGLAGDGGFTLMFRYLIPIDPSKQHYGRVHYTDRAGYFATALAAVEAKKEALEMIQAARNLKGL